MTNNTPDKTKIESATSSYKEIDYTPLSAPPKSISLIEFLKIPQKRKRALRLLVTMLVLAPIIGVAVALQDSEMSMSISLFLSFVLFIVAYVFIIYALKSNFLSELERDAYEVFLKKNNLTKVNHSITSKNTALIYRLITHHRKHHGFALLDDPVPIAIYNYSGSRKKGAVSTAANTALSVLDKGADKLVETEHFDTFSFTVIQCTLSTVVPNIIYDAHKNNSGHLLGQADIQNWLSKKQQYEFSGDFNEHFDVYIPPNYERDALYFTTPNIMAAMIDHGSDFDFEIVDNQLYLFKPHHVDFDDQASKQLVDTARYFGKLFEKATRLYSDDRANEGQAVHAEGQRLRQTITPDII